MPDVKLDDFRVQLYWPVQWGDQDMFGHVNNVVYFRWFESARVDYLNRLGLEKMHAGGGQGPILAHAGCNFLRQLQFPDTVRIGTRISRIGNTSFTLDHALFSIAQDTALVAEGTSIVVLFDYAAQKPIRIPDEIRGAIEKLEQKKFE